MELGRQARSYAPSVREGPFPYAHETWCVSHSVNMFVSSMGDGSLFLWKLKACPHLLLMGQDAVASCEFMLVSLDPGGAKRRGMKAEKGHMLSGFSLRHMASMIFHRLQGKDHVLVYALGSLILVMPKSLLPRVT